MGELQLASYFSLPTAGVAASCSAHLPWPLSQRSDVQSLIPEGMF